MIGQPGKISGEEFLQFNEQLLGLVRARVPIDKGLQTVADELGAGRLEQFTRGVAEDLSRGSQLSESLERRRTGLSDYYIALVRAGEKGGSLAEVLHHVVTQTRRQLEYRRAVVTSMIYPIGVLIIACAVVYFVSVTVVPQFIDIFEELGAEMPPPTRFVTDVFQFFGQNVEALIALAAIFIGGFALLALAPALRPARDALLLHLPIAGRMIYYHTIAGFCRCMGFLLQRGVPVPEALYLTQSVVQNTIARRFVGDLHAGVLRGESLSDSLQNTEYLPASTYWVLNLSEERGDLPETFLDLAELYEDKQSQTRRTVRGLIEPVLIAFLGITVGGLIVVLYLPLFTIPKVLS